MKIVVASASVPFTFGGAEMLEAQLVRELSARGHRVSRVQIPFEWQSIEHVRKSMKFATELQLPDSDLLIALKFPGWLIKHENVSVWVFHPFRQMYDFWERGRSGYEQSDPNVRSFRHEVLSADRASLSRAKGVFTYSQVNQERLARNIGLHADLLLTPYASDLRFQSREYGDYVVCIGRVNASKRQHLLIEALGRCKSPVRLVIGGVSEHSEYTKYLLHLVRLHQLEDRISILNRFVSDAEKVELLSGALAVYNGAEDEDNYAFVTAEAFLASRPVITHIDSGGVLMAVTDQKTGIVCEPKAEALAASIDMLYSDRSAARKYGENGLKWIAALDTSWDSVVSTLVGL